MTLVLLPRVLLARRRSVVARSRGRRLCGAVGSGFPLRKGIRAGPAMARRWVCVLGAGCTVWSLVGGTAGVVCGLTGAFLVHRWMRADDMRGPIGRSADGGLAKGLGRPRRRDGGTPADLPLAADLLAACVAAGAGPVEAAEAVGGSLDGLVGERLRHVAAEIRLGAEPERAWALFGSLPGAGGLAGLLQRATTSGAPVAAPALALAADCRARWARTAGAAARRAGVLVTAPLGLCFLPAFLILGVAPVLLGLAGELTRR
nr:type II secretion system F family protein [Streptomyces sp. SID11385]